jgi:hypothetical protein
MFIMEIVLYWEVYLLAISGSYDPAQSKFKVQSWDKYFVWLKLKLIEAFAPYILSLNFT